MEGSGAVDGMGAGAGAGRCGGTKITEAEKAEKKSPGNVWRKF